MISDIERQTIIDGEHLKILSICYWVWGGFIGLYTLFMVAYFGVLGTVLMGIGDEAEGFPASFGWAMLGFALLAITIAAALATFVVLSGFWIRRRRHRVASIVIAALLCPSVPFGTALGVTTIVVLMRPTVKSAYETARSASAGELAQPVTVPAPVATEPTDATS